MQGINSFQDKISQRNEKIKMSLYLFALLELMHEQPFVVVRSQKESLELNKCLSSFLASSNH
jgi:hypothetical protein